MTAENSRPWQGAADANGDADSDIVGRAPVKVLPSGGPEIDVLSHRDQMMLAASGIPVEFALALGVRSIVDAQDLPGELRVHTDALPGTLFGWSGVDGPHFQLRPYDPVEVDGRARKYLQAPNVNLLNVLPGRATPKQVYIVEGTKQSLAARAWAAEDVMVIGIPGCHNAMTDGSLLPGIADVVEDLPVAVIFDADVTTNENVLTAARRLGAALQLEGATKVGFVMLAQGSNDKTGLDDLLGGRLPEKRAKTLKRLVDAAVQSLPKQASGTHSPSMDDTRPALDVTADRLSLIREIVGVMCQRWDGSRLFNYGDVISELQDDRMVALDRGPLLSMLAESAYFYRPTKEGQKAAWPDSNTVVVVAAQAARFTSLERVSGAPFVRDDGSICQTPGYDEATRTFLLSDPALEDIDVPEAPTADEIRAARELLLDEWLGDLPLHEQADRANLLALVLTPLIRGLVSLVPMAVIDGLMMGVGKNLTADCIALYAMGRNADPLPYPDDDDEQRKVITSTFGTGAQLFVFDEAHHLRGKSLARALTATSYTDRILGVSRMACYPNTVTWVALGNQVQVHGDLARRVYRIALRPTEPDPDRRSSDQFRHPDLRSWTRANRAALIQAALTLVRGWYAAGQPAAPSPCTFGSFEAWERIVGGILHHAGVPSFLGNLRSWRTEADFDTGYWQDHLCEVGRQFPNEVRFTVGEVVDLMRGDFITEMPPDLVDPGSPGYPRALGQAYSRVKDRWFGDHRIVISGVPGQGGAQGRVNTWLIEQRDTAGPGQGHRDAAAEGSEGSEGPPNGAAGRLGGSADGTEGREESHNPSHKPAPPFSRPPHTSRKPPPLADPPRAVPPDPSPPSAAGRPTLSPVPITMGVEQERQMNLVAKDLSNRGLLIDAGLLEERLGEQRDRQAGARSRLVGDLTLRGNAATSTMPWTTRRGGRAFLALAGPDWPRRGDGNPIIDLDTLSRPLASARGRNFASVCSAIRELLEDGPWLRSLQTHRRGDRIHPEYSADTVTGRWTSRNPNVLGVGRRNDRLLADRDLLLAEPGEVFIGADLSGIDARCIAGLSGDVAYSTLF